MLRHMSTQKATNPTPVAKSDRMCLVCFMTSYSVVPKIPKSNAAERAIDGTIRRLLDIVVSEGRDTFAVARQLQIEITPAFREFAASSRWGKEIYRGVRHKFEVRLLPLAYKVYEEAMQAEQPMKIRLEAAKHVKDSVGLAARPSVEEVGGVALEDMSREEIHAYVKAARDKLVDFATLVDVVNGDGGSAQDIDNIDID